MLTHEELRKINAEHEKDYESLNAKQRKYMTNTNQTAAPVAEKIEFQKWDCINLLDMSKNLKGENALQGVFDLLEDPEDEVTRGLALYEVVRFYFHTKALVKEIDRLFMKKENDGGSNVVENKSVV